MAKNQVEQYVDPIIVANEDIIAYREKLVREVGRIEERLKTLEAIEYKNSEIKLENKRLLIENEAHKENARKIVGIIKIHNDDLADAKQKKVLFDIEYKKKEKQLLEWDDILSEKQREFDNYESNLRLRLNNIKAQEEKIKDFDGIKAQKLAEIERLNGEVIKIKKQRLVQKEAYKRETDAIQKQINLAKEKLEDVEFESRRSIETANKHTLSAQNSVESATKKAAQIIADAEDYKKKVIEEYEPRLKSISEREVDVSTREKWVKKKYNDLRDAKLQLEEFYQKPIKHIVFVDNDVKILSKEDS